MSFFQRFRLFLSQRGSNLNVSMLKQTRISGRLDCKNSHGSFGSSENSELLPRQLLLGPDDAGL